MSNQRSLNRSSTIQIIDNFKIGSRLLYIFIGLILAIVSLLVRRFILDENFDIGFKNQSRMLCGNYQCYFEYKCILSSKYENTLLNLLILN